MTTNALDEIKNSDESSWKILGFCCITGLIAVLISYVLNHAVFNQEMESYENMNQNIADEVEQQISYELDNTSFKGYTKVDVYEICDMDTGVIYAITESGDMEPLYNPDGSLKVVENLEELKKQEEQITEEQSQE